MSNYITIESGYFKPFKENETDPKLKPWADKYFEIIKKIHEVLMPYDKRYKHLCELFDRITELKKKKDKMFDTIRCQYKNPKHAEIENQLSKIKKRYVDIDKNRDYWGLTQREYDEMIKENRVRENELLEEKGRLLFEDERQKEDLLKEQFLQSLCKDEMNSIFDDKEINYFISPYDKNEEMRRDLLWRYDHISELSFSQEYIEQDFLGHISKDSQNYKAELRECLLHRVWGSRETLLINESNIVLVELINGSLKIRTDVLTIEACVFAFDDDGVCEFVHNVESMGNSSFSSEIRGILEKEFRPVFSGCSVQETYKDFQSNNIEKIIKDKIKCGEIKTYNISVDTDFYCQYH